MARALLPLGEGAFLEPRVLLSLEEGAALVRPARPKGVPRWRESQEE